MNEIKYSLPNFQIKKAVQIYTDINQKYAHMQHNKLNGNKLILCTNLIVKIALLLILVNLRKH